MAKTHFANEIEESSSKQDEYPHNVSVSNIRQTLRSLEPPLSAECCIYMVPKKLRRVNEAAYTPQVVSIGPLHYGKKTLNNMQKHKLRYLDKFLERAANSASLEDFVSTITEWESSIRCCYAETFDHLSSDKFVKMILVDAGFIFELFLRDHFPDLRDPNDSILYKPWLETDIEQDLILLENQLPFFVLEGLYNLAFPSNLNNFPSFHELTCRYFPRYFPSSLQFFYDSFLKMSIHPEVKHFTDTDMLRSEIDFEYSLETAVVEFSSYTPHDAKHDAKQDDRIDHLHSATELHDTGVRFMVSSGKCLLNIEYRDGVLTIPCLKLDDNTERYIRNLMALEQCHYPKNTYICHSVVLMGYLINTTKDVDLLIEKKIIVNMLGNRVLVVTLFNNLCTHIALSNNSRYAKVFKDLNEYYEVRHHRWIAILMDEYFSTPWRITSSTGAIILLVLTLTQTICAIISLWSQAESNPNA